MIIKEFTTRSLTLDKIFIGNEIDKTTNTHLQTQVFIAIHKVVATKNRVFLIDYDHYEYICSQYKICLSYKLDKP